MPRSETWLSDKSDPENMNNVTTNAILPEGFSINHVPRTDGRDGGGVGFISNKMVDAKVEDILVNQNYKQFESMTVLLKFNNFAVYISVVYRPPPSKVNKLKIRSFWPEWFDFLSFHVAKKSQFVIVGDLNLHLDEIDNNNTTKFNNILTELDLCQHIDQPTHIHGHTLDVLITQTECDLVSNIRVYDPCFVNDSGQSVQDHYLLECNIVGKKKTYKPRTIFTRKWKYVNFENFQEDLEKLKDIPAYTSTDTNTLVELYNTELSKLADHHAPLRAVTLKRNLNPWYNNDIKKLKQGDN